MKLKRGDLIFIEILIVLTLLSASSVSAFSTSTPSYSVNSYHFGTAGNNASTPNYEFRSTTTYQQGSNKDGSTTNYQFNSGWFNVSVSVQAEVTGNVTINEIFFSNKSVFIHSNVFNSSEIVYDMNLTYIGANCTAQTGSVSNVTFRLFNVEDNVNYINTTGYTYRLNESGNLTDLYILNSSYVIRDSGNWTLFVNCSGSSESPLTNTTVWEISWGVIQVNLINPIVDTTVTIYEFFTFSTNVSCSNGECDLVNITLDPEEINCVEEEVCEEIIIGTECVNETVQSCDEECSVEIVEECVEETNEVCESVITQICNDIETCEDECTTDEEGVETCNEICSIEEVCEDVTEEQCSDITEKVCSEAEKEICVEINCIENLEEVCNDIVEQNCTTEVVCDIDYETPVETPSNETEDSEEQNSSREEEPDSTEEQVPLPEINETIGNETEIDLPEINETIEEEQEMLGKEFNEGEILETKEGKDLGEKTQDEAEYETHFLLMEQDETEFRVVFYHDYNNTLPIRIEGDVNYTLNKNESDYLENVSLVVELIEGILPQFELHIGEESEVFTFGKVIPVIELKQGNYTLIDRDDLKLDVRVEFDSDESIVLRGLEDEPNVNITLGTNSQEDVSTSIIAVPFINIENATIILEKSAGINAIISCKDENFNYETLECSNWRYANVDFVESNETIEFNIEHFTAYAGGNLTASETAFLTIWDENDVGMPNASTNTTSIKTVNETIRFFADYELAQNGTKITDGNCSISFSDISGNMTYNSTYTYFLYERNFTSNGNYPYTVNCASSTYTNLNASDSIVIGAFSNETKGAISTTVGDVPFYTTSANPQQTDNLRGGESQTITWSVNATGILDKIYDFFVEAAGLYVSSVNSSHVNIQISASDTTPPVFVSTTATPSAVINGSDVTINANVNDNVQVDIVTANITLPDDSTFFISSLPFVYTTNVSQIGVHNVIFTANDSSGNIATTTKTFTTALPINLIVNVEVSVDLTANISSKVTASVLVAGTNEVLSTTEISGSAALLLPSVPVDISFETSFDNDTSLTLLFNFNLSESTGGSINFGNIRIDPFLLTYGVDTNFSFTSAQVIISYTNATFTNEDNLQLHKCNNYAVGTGTCISGFNDVTSDSVTVHDKDKDTFTYNTTTFSGFGIKEVTPSQPSGGGGTAISPIIPSPEPAPELEPVPITPTIPEQLFDISLSLDDAIIESSNELSAIVTFESFGTEPTPVSLTFIILDENGNEVHREEDSLTVITEEVLRKNFEELNLPQGKYTFVLQTLYNVDVFDEFRQEFEISFEKKGIGIWTWIVLGIILLILIIGLIWWLLIKKHKKKKRKMKRKIKKNA